MNVTPAVKKANVSEVLNLSEIALDHPADLTDRATEDKKERDERKEARQLRSLIIFPVPRSRASGFGADHLPIGEFQNKKENKKREDRNQ